MKYNSHSRLATAFKMSGFSPNDKEGVGAGLACAILMALDLPMMLIAVLWNLTLGRLTNFELRSMGLVAFKEIYNPKATLGGILTFVLLAGAGIGCWFNHAALLSGGTVTYQQVMIYAAILCGVADILISSYVHYRWYMKHRRSPQTA